MLKLIPFVLLIVIAQGAMIEDNTPTSTHVNFDWEKILRCLKEAQTLVPEVLQLIEAIKTEDYATAISLVIKVIGEGSEVVKKCISLFGENIPTNVFLGKRFSGKAKVKNMF